MPGRFELYRDLRERFRFRLKADDGSVILSSDGFEQKAAALDAMVSIMKSVQEASIVDLTGGDARRYGDEPEEPYSEASYREETYDYDEYAYGDEAYEAFGVGSPGAGRGKKGKGKKKKGKKEGKGKGKRAREGDREGNKGRKGRRAGRKKKK